MSKEQSLTPASPSAPATAEDAREKVGAWFAGELALSPEDGMSFADDFIAAFPSLTAPASAAGWQCVARKYNGPDTPADCDWPVCGCDPQADKVIAALDESGHLKSPHAGSAWRDGNTGASLGFVGGLLSIQRKDGSGRFVFPDDDDGINPETDDETGRLLHVLKLDASELIAIRNFLNDYTSAPASAASFRDGVEAAAKVVENMPLQIYRDEGIGPRGMSCKQATFEDAVERIRALTPPAASQDSGADSIAEPFRSPRLGGPDFQRPSPETTDVRERGPWPPEVLWLQWNDHDGDDTTWCRDQISEDDVRYVRTPDIAATGGVSGDEVAEWRRLERAATMGPWEAAGEYCSDLAYGSGPDAPAGYNYQKMTALDGKSLFDSLNTDAAHVEEEWDEDGHYAWDDVAKRNFAFIAAARTAVPKLIDALTAERERAEKAEALAFRLNSGAELQSVMALHNDAVAEVTRLTEKLAAYRRAYGCLSCGEDHPETTMCPPHEMRTTGRAAYDATMRHAVARAFHAESRVTTLEEALRWIDRQRYENRETIPAAIDSPQFRRIRETLMAIMDRARDALAVRKGKS